MTVSIGGSLRSATAGFKWNLWNSDLWSFSINPWVGYQFTSPYYSKERQTLVAVSLALSRVIDVRHKLHFSLEAGKNRSTYAYSYSYDNNYSTSDSSSELVAARVTASYEVRFNRRHGMSLWLSSNIMRSESNYASTNSNPSYRGYNSLWKSNDAQLEPGLGYQVPVRALRFGSALGSVPTGIAITPPPQTRTEIMTEPIQNWSSALAAD